MKVSHTRMDNRHQRPRVENCRDESQFALIGEVKSIHDSITVLNEELRRSQEMKRELMIQRGNLEREIMLKRRTINIDRERIQLIRTHFPSTTALTGYWIDAYWDSTPMCSSPKNNKLFINILTGISCSRIAPIPSTEWIGMQSIQEAPSKRCKRSMSSLQSSCRYSRYLIKHNNFASNPRAICENLSWC